MAALNIKNFPDALHRKLKARAKREHRSLSQEVVHLLTEALEKPNRRSILELEGLGKEIWKDIDPVEHVKRERASWD